MAEESGLIEPIGAWVLQEACRQVAQWQQIPSWENITVAVNLSAVQFLRGDLMATIMTALDASGLAPDSLELEVTESVLVRDQERVTNVVQQIRRLGIRLAIDDFGTGYSSLSYLKRFPVSKLKIDQSFVRNMTTSSEDAEIVRATIQMGHALGLKTIAEGIEDETTAHFLRLQHCDQAQGYYFGYPVPADEFSESYLSAGPATRDNSA